MSAKRTTSRLVRALHRALEPGESMDTLTVLTPDNDPYRVPGIKRKIAAGEWLTDQLARLDADPDTFRRTWHLRGLHYALLGTTKPDGSTYINDLPNWAWLGGDAAKTARWSGLVPFERIVDERNAEPFIRLAEDIDPRALAWNGLTGIDADDVLPRLALDGFDARQRYRIALIAEKSSARDILEPLSETYGTDLYLPTGEISDTYLHTMAKSAYLDGRPLIVIYFSDADPSGWQMSISISRKLQAFRDLLSFRGLKFKVMRAGLTPSQVRAFRDAGEPLPETPMKETEKRAGAWFEAFGVMQTELDSLAALRPNIFRQMAIDAIEPWFDSSLAGRVEQARDEWLSDAQDALNERLGEDVLSSLEADAEALLARADRVRDEAEALLPELTEVPAVPDPVLDPDRELPGLLIDSGWDFRDQCIWLKESKAYEVE